MTENATFLDALVAALGQAGVYNRNDQLPPTAVLWPDRERQWEPLMPRLRDSLPILTLGDYRPEARTGPAVWIRCMVSRSLDEDVLPPEAVPIIYLPGVSRQELRAVEECPVELQPLVEYLYRGVLWSQKNGRDWTVAAFLQSRDGGLGIEVGADAATRDSMLRSLGKLADETVEELLRRFPLRASFFDALLNPDPRRRLLLWLNEPARYRGRLDPGEWAAFRGMCRRDYGFDPEKDGEFTGARLLAGRSGAWGAAWDRFRESPQSYPNLPDLLRRARPQMELPFASAGEEVWPQENDGAEEALRQRLAELQTKYQTEACSLLEALEAEHAARRSSVWADLGCSPLAMALKHVAELASLVGRPLSGDSVERIAEAYADWGWKADAAVMEALAAVEKPEDVAAVKAAVRSVYGPWLEKGAVAFQQAAISTGAEGYPRLQASSPTPGVCILFCDGLRMDLGRRVSAMLEKRGLACQVGWQLAALPGVTSTAKPAVSPVASLLGPGEGLELVVASTGTQLTAEGLRRLLSDAGYQIIKGDDLGDPSGRGWTELGDIDSYGHEYGWMVSHQVGAELRGLASRIEALLADGWREVRVVTDHGWLMLPGGLPKVDLPEHLTGVRKGRCARLRDGSTTDELVVPWFWDHEVRIAVARGLGCYEAGREWEHGGLSPQECVVPVVSVSLLGSGHSSQVAIGDLAWKGLRCTIGLSGPLDGVLVDLRRLAGDGNSSLAGSKVPDSDGVISFLVQDEDLLGQSVWAVVVGPDGGMAAQIETKVGG